ncbi:DNA helicase UvrD [Candidatus Uhrbacteria bacterium CG10_big_fil_rev_8_21_14_0_10_48_11]|uniref:DNA helicase UvrD n=1 Tax=Candidatus Uhrbacteria bacterium CG10_big_fil_rev_8_21_14_0_10_48_11 TaxID=1975037 RepID=A0A2M8LFH9_9BACT|nr:MAG: DNA helicase UvrD [Candidatus Uhrbacteria bacterium CG10_big_fil_rev_8_21_14_0_10_48_11]
MSEGVIVDLHIHSRFSRACSQGLTIPNIARTAALKGIHLMGTGDFTHPGWRRLLHEELEQSSSGFYRARGVATIAPVEFVPSVEISCIYSKGGKVRRQHVLVIVPTLKVADALAKRLEKIGNLMADGRPILGLDAKELLKIVLDTTPDALVIPAHAWTPWFSLFGSKSGFDSIEECFEELTPHIPAIETGLSSDPPMNWRLSALDGIRLLSNSDAHSLDNLGREANVFKRGSGLTYQRLLAIVRGVESDGFLSTIEFYPEEGKYYTDGHAACKLRLTPEETKRYGGRCPKCGRLITVGVLSRVNDLADRKPATTFSGRVPFNYIVPLREIIAEVLGVGKKTKRVAVVYDALVPKLGTEFDLLLSVPISTIYEAGFLEVAKAIERVRLKKIKIVAGYDGVFGIVSVSEGNAVKKKKQKKLFA